MTDWPHVQKPKINYHQLYIEECRSDLEWAILSRLFFGILSVALSIGLGCSLNLTAIAKNDLHHEKIKSQRLEEVIDEYGPPPPYSKFYQEDFNDILLPSIYNIQYLVYAAP